MTGVGTFFAGEVSVASTYLFASSLYSYSRDRGTCHYPWRYSSSGMIRVLPEALEEAEADALSEELGEVLGEPLGESVGSRPVGKRTDILGASGQGKERQGQYRPEGYCVGWVLD